MLTFSPILIVGLRQKRMASEVGNLPGFVIIIHKSRCCWKRKTKERFWLMGRLSHSHPPAALLRHDLTLPFYVKEQCQDLLQWWQISISLYIPNSRFLPSLALQALYIVSSENISKSGFATSSLRTKVTDHLLMYWCAHQKFLLPLGLRRALLFETKPDILFAET